MTSSNLDIVIDIDEADQNGWRMSLHDFDDMLIRKIEICLKCD